jgi:hypothetical protein
VEGRDYDVFIKTNVSADLTKLTTWPIKNLPAIKESKFRVCRILESLLLDHTKNQFHPAHNHTVKLSKIYVLRISYRPHPDITLTSSRWGSLTQTLYILHFVLCVYLLIFKYKTRRLGTQIYQVNVSFTSNVTRTFNIECRWGFIQIAFQFPGSKLHLTKAYITFPFNFALINVTLYFSNAQCRYINLI